MWRRRPSWTGFAGGDKIAQFVRHAYPLMLDLSKRLVVIVGGGNVAARKAFGVVEADAGRVVVVATRFLAPMPPLVERVEQAYRAEHLRGAGLVFAATNVAAVNDAVVRDAQKLGVLVSRADTSGGDPGDFITPARFKEGPVTVTVSTGSPALAVVIRNGLARRFEPAWARMAEAMCTLRPMIVTAPSLTPERRSETFRDLATDEAIELLGREGEAGLRKWLLRRYPELSDA